MSIFSGLFMREYMAYAAASAVAAAMQNQSSSAYLAANAAAMQNAKPSPLAILGMANANQPTAHERDRWKSRELGIPSIAEDIQ